MRAAFGLALLAAATTLGGCGQSEAQIRDEIRAQLMNRCSRDVAPGTADLPGFDSAAFCGCITDKAMGQRSVAELKSLFDEGTRPALAAQGRQAASECLAQLGEGALATTAPAPATTNSSAPEPAPAPAPAAERERPREKAVEPAAPPRPRAEDVRDTPQPATQPVATPPQPPRPATPAPTPTPRPEPEQPAAKEGPRGQA